jgi:hypothetical protein
MGYIIEIETAADLQRIKSALLQYGDVLVEEKPGHWKAYDGLTDDQRHLAFMNSRVYAMNEIDRAEWERTHPYLPGTKQDYK